MEFSTHFSFQSPGKLNQLLFHPALNTVFGCSTNGQLYCFDTSSGNLIKSYEVSEENESQLLLALLPNKDRFVVCHGRKFNARTELNGTLLLESILQTKVLNTSDSITIDLSHADAVYFLKVLQSFDPTKYEEDISIKEFHDFLSNLEEAVAESEIRLNALPTKLTRWETVSVKANFSVWKATIIVVLKHILPVNSPLEPGLPQGASNPNYHDVPGLPVLAAIMDRLRRLAPPGDEINQQGSVQLPRTMNAEVDRRATFALWPHMDYKWALPDQMAQAGFFQSSGSAEAEDRALCFICRVCLVCWESTDEPWAEHERHSEICPFVKGQYTHNIPIRVTHGTETAVSLREHHSKITHLSATNSQTLIATAAADGEVVIWDLTLRIRQVARFNIKKAANGSSEDVTITSVCLMDVTSPRARENFVHEHLLVVSTNERTNDMQTSTHLYAFEVRQVIQVLIGRPQFLGKYSSMEPEVGNSEDESDPPTYWDGLLAKLHSKESKLQQDDDYMMGYDDVDDEIAGITSNTAVEIVISSGNLDCDLGFPPMDSSPPMSANPVTYAQTNTHGQRTVPSMDEWNRLNYCLGEYRCSGHHVIDLESGAIVKQILPYPGPHRHPNMFICLYNTTSLNEEYSTSGGIIVYKGINEELSRVVFLNDNTPVQVCPMEPDPCDPDVTPSTGGTGEDSDDAVEPVPPKKTKPTMCFGEDPLGTTSSSSLLTGGRRLPSALLAVVTAGGDLAVLDVQHCESRFIARYTGKFTCIEFCSGMDRICAASSDGKVHFLSIGSSELSDENNHPELVGLNTFEESVADNLNGAPIVGQTIPGASSSEGSAACQAAQPDLFDDPDLLVNSLRDNLGLIHELVQYEPLTGRVHVSLPPCWSQVEREEHQTAPLHNFGYPVSQMINLGLGSSPRIISGTSSGGPPGSRSVVEAFVGSWKLTADGSTWREHVMEIVFPKVITVGHIDLKLRLQDMPTGTNMSQSIYVTLLRQNVSSQTSPNSLGASLDGAGNSTAGLSGLDALVAAACMQPEMMSGAEMGLTLTDLDAPFIDEDNPECNVTSKEQQPPPISEMQLRQLNAEVIAGPYRLSDYLDLNGQTAVIPLTSVDLMKVRTRFYAVYISTPAKEPHAGYRRMVAGLVNAQTTAQHPVTKPSGSNQKKAKAKLWGEPVTTQSGPFQFPQLGISNSTLSLKFRKFANSNVNGNSNSATNANSASKSAEWYGCDMIRQITLTIHRFKRMTPVPRERLQRMAILRNSDFHVHLVELLAGGQQTPYNVIRILDILNWIVVMYANDIHVKRSSIYLLLSRVAGDLDSIIRYCLIGGDRSTAKKVAKFLLQLIELEKNGLIDERKSCESEANASPPFFHACLLDCLLNNLPLLLLSDSPAGVRWFFFLLGRLRGVDISQASQSVACLLRELTGIYKDRTADLNLALLRSDFGIFSNPLDPVLFDIDASVVLEESRSGNTSSNNDTVSGKPQSYSASVKAGSVSSGWDWRGKNGTSSGEVLSSVDLLKDLLPLLSSSSSYDLLYDEADWRSCGLTETEPLHFTCHTSSSDTKLERGSGNLEFGSVNVPQPSQQLDVAFEPYFLSNISPLYKAKQHQLMKLHLKKQLLEAKLTEAKKAVQQQHLQALQTLTNTVQKSLTTSGVPSSTQSPWYIPSTPQTTPAVTADTTPKHCTPSVSPPSEGMKPGRSNSFNGPGPSRVAAAAAAAALSSPLIKSGWCQNLLSPPAPHEMVMERNHGGARRFVVLDFGRMVYLTDVIIPANEQLSSLSLDVWLHYEDIDGQRLVHVTDIATRPLVLCDLQPPTVCRYLKITVCSSFKVASLAQRSRVRIGNFYGHSVPHPEAVNTCSSHPLIHAELEAHIQQVAAVLEDNRCRYGLSRDLLRRQLRAYYPTTTTASAPVSTVTAGSSGSTSNISGPPPATLGGVSATSSNSTTSTDNTFLRLRNAVQQCFVLQRLVNFSQRTLERLQRILAGKNPNISLLDRMSTDASLSSDCIARLSSHASTDKIRVLLEACLSYILYCQSAQACEDTLSSSSLIKSLEVGQCILQTPGGDSLSSVFRDLIAFGTKRMQVMSCCLFSDLCCVASITKQLNLRAWLKEWLSGMLRSFFAANSDQIVPRSRVFLLICTSLQRLISAGLGRLILTDLLKVLEELLTPLMEQPSNGPQPMCFIDQELLNWMLLLTTKALDFLPRKENEVAYRHQPRWEFLSWHHRQKRRAKRGLQGGSTSSKSHSSTVYTPTVLHTSSKSIGKNPFSGPDFNPKLIKKKLHKRLLHHRDQLMNLTKSQEDFLNVTMAQHSDSAQGSSKSHFGGKEAAKLYIIKKKEDEFNSKLQLITKKHVKDMLQIRKNDLDICRRTKRSAKETFPGNNAGRSGSSSSSFFSPQFLAAASSLAYEVPHSNSVPPSPLLKQRAIPVVRLLFTLLCRLDASCSSDTFLRTCKLIGHIMRTCQPPLHLTEAVEENVVSVLLHRFASASLVSSLGEAWAGPYGLHAVACLFSDLLDLEEEQNYINQQTASIALNVKPESMTAPIAAQEESTVTSDDAQRSHSTDATGSKSTTAAEMDFLKQIDLFESDDSEGSELREELKSQVKESWKDEAMDLMTDDTIDGCKSGQDATSNANLPAAELVARFITTNFSSAYDCRLEHGLEWRQEMEIMRYMAQAQVSCNMTLAQASVIANPHVISEDETTLHGADQEINEPLQSAKSLLSRCLNDLICRQRSENLYLMPLLQMWLLLNQRSSEQSANQVKKRPSTESSTNQSAPNGSVESDADSAQLTGSLPRWSATTQPSLALTKKSLQAFLVSLTEEPHPLCVLHLGLRVLVLTCNQRGEDELVPFLLSSSEFKNFLIHLLNASPPDRQNNLVGPAMLDLLEELLFRLRLYCSNDKTSFAPFVLEILTKLTAVDSGPLFAGYGPIDLQCKWVLTVCEENFSQCDTSLLLNLVYSISRLALRQLRLLTPSLTPQWSCSSNFTGLSSNAKDSQNTKTDRGMPAPHVCFTSVCSSSGVLTKNDPDKSYEALCNRNRLVTALMSLLHHVVAPNNAMESSMMSETRGNQDNRADEQKILDTNNSAPALADVILGNEGDGQPVQQLMCCLSLCVSNVFSGIGSDLSLLELVRELMPHLQPRSIGDWTLLTLKQIYSHCTSRQVFLDALLSFLSSSPASAIHEPLLLLVAWILADETPSNQGENLRYFLQQGGLRGVASRFVEVARHMIGTQSSCVRSTEVDLLTGDLSSSRLPLDEDSPANLAPVCVVTCTSGAQGGSSSGSECLLQSAQTIHRRVKCAQWSYNFFPDESYTELSIRVPSPALLSELIVIPHLAALQSSPSAISFELHLDGALVYSLSGPVQTAGMPQVRICLPPTLANGVTLRLHRPRPVDSVGLSHIQLRGYSLFSAKLPHSGGLSPAFAWLRLFHFVLDAASVVSSPGISAGDLVGAVVEQVPALLPHLCAQITSGGADAMSSSSTSCIAESVLLTLSRLCPPASLHILRCFLKMPISDERDFHLCPLFYQWEGVESNAGTENLIYRIAHERDEWTGDRMSLLLHWLTSVSTRQSMITSDSFMESLSSVVVPGLHVGCIAVVLWEASTEVESYSGHLPWRNDLITEDLLRNVYNWYLAVCPQNPDMRRALACLMCSLCALSPTLFTRLLDWTKVSGMIRLTDDSKSILDDKSAPAWPGREQLEVLAVVSQSRACLPQLYSSGLLELLSNQLLRFSRFHLQKAAVIHPWGNFVDDIGVDTDTAKFTRKKAQAERSSQTKEYSTFTAEGASGILQFLTQIMEGNSRVNAWLGSAENIAFWRPLIALLMIGPSFQPPTAVCGGLTDSDRISLEQAAIEYFVTVTKFSEANQTRFSQIVCDALMTLASQVSCRVSGSESMDGFGTPSAPLCLPSFLRRLILQVMLEEGRIEVILRTSADEDDDVLPRQLPGGLPHPELGAGYGRCIIRSVATETLSSVAEELLHQRAIQGSSLAGGYSSSLTASVAGQTLLSNVSNIGSNEEKVPGFPSQGLTGQLSQFTVSEFHTTSQALQLLDQISTSAGLNINLNKKGAQVPAVTKKIGTNSQKDTNGSAKTPQSELPSIDTNGSHSLTYLDALLKLEFRHRCFGENPLPMNCTLGQILIAISMNEGCIPSRLELTVKGRRLQKPIIASSSSSADSGADVNESLASLSRSESTSTATGNSLEDSNPLTWCLNLRKQPLTPLDSFAAINGLSALAELLHLLVPGICRLNMTGGSTEAMSDSQKRQTGSASTQSATPSQVVTSELWEDFTFSSDMDFDPYSEMLNSGGFISMADLQNQVMIGATPRTGRTGPGPQGTLPALPAHTLIAFALFLRLTGYADLLLSRERRLAVCLLRLMMGVTEDANGDSLLTGGDSSSLPQLPFTVLCQLLRTVSQGTDDAAVLQRRCLDLGIVELCLASLAILSHQEPANGAPPTHPVVAMTVEALQAQMSSGRRKPEGGKVTGVPAGSSSSQPTNVANTDQVLSTQQQQQQQQQKLYWAKGTGFGTGSTVSSWDAEQTLLRQRMEEEHCTAILHVLAAFIRPGPDILDSSNDLTILPPFNSTSPSGLGSNAPRVLQMLQDSCLISAMASYLRNDSVLDMTRHVSLYRALLVVLRSLALDSELRVLLRAQPSDSSPTDISSLLASMKRCVDTYAARLKVGTKVAQPDPDAELETMTASTDENVSDGAGLAQLIPDIQKTANLVEEALRPPNPSSSVGGSDENGSRDGESTKSSQDYCTRMKPLQFDTFNMLRERSDGSIVFLVPHFHSSTIQHQHVSGTSGSISRSRRLAQETVTLSTSLPLSESSSVFVRCDEDRLDVMKALITGPTDTPYANGCFEFDVYFPTDYPKSPPQVQLKTTGNQTVRFNPNLYNCGKVCLSILNTWHGRPEEKWNGKTSSFLQVLVSIQSLILVSEPYFNEPGYERSRGTPCGTIASRDYDANIRQATVRWGMLDMLRRPPEAFRQVVQNHFYLKKEEILKQVNEWITEMSLYTNTGSSGGASAAGQQSTPPPPPPPPPATPSTSSAITTIPPIGSAPTAVTNSVAKHNLIQLKKYFAQLQEELNKLEDPSESPPGDHAVRETQQSVDDTSSVSSIGASTVPQTINVKSVPQNLKGFDVVDAPMPQSSQSIDEEPNDDDGIIL